MLAAVYHDPHDLRVEQVPTPGAGPGELLVRVKAASICGTDLRILDGGHRRFPPGTVRIPGHEVAGTIAQVGTMLEGYKEGELVIIAPNMGCGQCRECISGNNNRCARYQAIGVTMDGGFAEYLRLPAESVRQGNIIPMIAGTDPAVAALIEPFACVLRGQEVLHIRPGETVLVIGAGPIGIMHAMLAELRGAGQVIASDTAPERIELGRDLGLERVVNSAEVDLEEVVQDATAGQGADVVIVAAPSHQAQESALHLAGIGGRINFFGGLPKDRPSIQFDSNLVHYKELIVTATTACSTRDCREAAQIVNSGLVDLGQLISQRFPLEQAQEAFAAARDRRKHKIVLEP